MVDNTLYADGLVFPRPTLVAGTTDVVFSVSPPTLVAGTNDVVLSVPVPTLVSRIGDHSVIVTAPAPTLSSDATHGEVATLALSVPPPELSATALSGEVITAALRAPVPELVAVNFTPAVITVAGSAPAPRATIAVLSGSVLTAAIEAAAPTLVAAGYPAYTITAVLVAPAPRLDAELSGAIIAAFRVWALNTRKLALTEYTNFEFNSFAVFNGVVLGCGSNGVVVLGTQGLDNTTAITGRYRTGQESFGSSLHKRVPRIYTSGSFAGDMLFRTITVEGGTRTYSLPANGITGLQQRRVPVGKGPKSRFFQFEGENVSGADFSVNDVLVLPTALRRRVQ